MKRWPINLRQTPCFESWDISRELWDRNLIIVKYKAIECEEKLNLFGIDWKSWIRKGFDDQFPMELFFQEDLGEKRKLCAVPI